MKTHQDKQATLTGGFVNFFRLPFPDGCIVAHISLLSSGRFIFVSFENHRGDAARDMRRSLPSFAAQPYRTYREAHQRLKEEAFDTKDAVGASRLGLAEEARREQFRPTAVEMGSKHAAPKPYVMCQGVVRLHHLSQHRNLKYHKTNHIPSQHAPLAKGLGRK